MSNAQVYKLARLASGRGLPSEEEDGASASGASVDLVAEGSGLSLDDFRWVGVCVCVGGSTGGEGL